MQPCENQRWVGNGHVAEGAELPGKHGENTRGGKHYGQISPDPIRENQHPSLEPTRRPCYSCESPIGGNVDGDDPGANHNEIKYRPENDPAPNGTADLKEKVLHLRDRGKQDDAQTSTGQA